MQDIKIVGTIWIQDRHTLFLQFTPIVSKQSVGKEMAEKWHLYNMNVIQSWRKIRLSCFAGK